MSARKVSQPTPLEALCVAVAEFENGPPSESRQDLPAMRQVILNGKATHMQVLVAIASRRVARPDVPASALQGSENRDIRSIASRQVSLLTGVFQREGARVRLSADPGVSQPFRVPDLDSEWLAKRRSKAEGQLLLDAVAEIEALQSKSERDGGLLLVVAAVFERARTSAIDYYLPARPRLQQIIKQIMRFVAVGSGGVRTECVVGAMAKAVLAPMINCDETELTSVNADSPYDGLLRQSGEPVATVEATELPLEVGKLQLEVLRGLKETGARQAFVISKAPRAAHEAAVSGFIEEQYMKHDLLALSFACERRCAQGFSRNYRGAG
jgi:hypothetical protein